MDDAAGRRLLALAWAMFACFVAAVLLDRVGLWVAPDVLRDAVLFCGIPVVAAAAVVLHARARPKRTERLMLAAALGAFAVGSAYDTLVNYELDSVPFPSFADACYLVFYILLIGVVARVIRSSRSGRGSAVWLDAAIAVLGCGSVALVAAGVVVPPDSTTAEVFVTMLYPALDAALLALAVSAYILDGMRLNRLSAWFVGSVLVMLVADVAYSLALEQVTYIEGGPLDVMWLLGALGLATGAFGRFETGEQQDHVSTRLLLPGIAATLAALVLVWDHFHQTNEIALVMAVGTLVLTAVRTFRSNRLLRELWRTQLEARSDPLTGLPNRRALVEQLDQWVDDSIPFVCVTLDLNGFKEVNDELGHASGDVVLRTVARRLSSIPGVDAPFRTGGDEFVFLAPGASDDAERLALAIHRSLAPEMSVGGTVASIGASLGYASWPSDTVDLDELMSFSDAAMYRAKRSGRQVVAHTAADDVPGSPRFQILQEVRAQIERGVVRLEYQPQIDLGAMRTVGVEALVRFRSAELGSIPPDQAIPVIETNGLMVDFTTLVVRQAIDDALQLQRRGAFVQMSVNIAVSCLHSETFVQMLRAEVRGRCTELHRPLVLELTEEAMMYEVADVLPVLDSLRDDGCQIAMDDFGKGYSSIARLLQLPIDIIKFDKELIDGDPADPATRAVVHSIAQLGTALGLTTLAEGTETADQVAMVRELGVDHCQGYFFSASMPVEELPSWIRTQDERHAAPGRTRVGPEPVVASKR